MKSSEKITLVSGFSCAGACADSGRDSKTSVHEGARLRRPPTAWPPRIPLLRRCENVAIVASGSREDQRSAIFGRHMQSVAWAERSARPITSVRAADDGFRWRSTEPRRPRMHARFMTGKRRSRYPRRSFARWSPACSRRADSRQGAARRVAAGLVEADLEGVLLARRDAGRHVYRAHPPRDRLSTRDTGEDRVGSRLRGRARCRTCARPSHRRAGDGAGGRARAHSSAPASSPSATASISAPRARYAQTGARKPAASASPCATRGR